MDLWTSKSLTESHFLSADKEIAKTINDLIEYNRAEVTQNFKLARLYLIQKLRSFQSILKNVAIKVYQFSYEMEEIDVHCMFENEDIKNFLWSHSGKMKIEIIKNFIETETNTDIKERMDTFYQNAILPFLKDFEIILNDVYVKDQVQTLLHDVHHISFH